MRLVIYTNQSGGVSILVPTGELSVEEVACKDVPAGIPYKIVESSDIPNDRTFRDAWELEIVEPDGYGIGAEAWFAEQEALNDND